MRLIVFDFDGTLADTFPEIVRALKSAMEELGYPLAEPDTIRRWIGYGLREFMTRALPVHARNDSAIGELTERFRAIVGGDSTSVVKPDARVYAFLLNELKKNDSVPGAGFAEVWMVGDSEPDMEFARNIGARAVGCLCGLRDHRDLVDAGANFIAERPLDLLEILAR